MTLVQLANFVRICELQSFSKAAAVIRIAQPALSRQVRNLEAELGGDLLVRHAWGVTPTPAGEVLVVLARRLLLDADAARDAVQALKAQPAGRVAVGVPTSVANALLPPLARALRARYPLLRPHFTDGFSAALHARTLAGELDLAVLYEDRAIGPLTTAPLLSEHLILVGSVDAEIVAGSTVDMLTAQSLILPARPNRLRLIVDEALATRSEPLKPVLEVDSLSAIISMVRSGMGLTVLPYSTVASEVEGGALRVWNLASPQLSRTLLLVRPLNRQSTAAVTAVETELRAAVLDLSVSLRWSHLGA